MGAVLSITVSMAECDGVRAGSRIGPSLRTLAMCDSDCGWRGDFCAGDFRGEVGGVGQALRAGGGAQREEWTIRDVAAEPSDAFAKQLQKLPADASADALLDALRSVRARSVDLGTHDRRVVVPLAPAAGNRPKA